jgi:hypothetical protein
MQGYLSAASLLNLRKTCHIPSRGFHIQTEITFTLLHGIVAIRPVFSDMFVLRRLSAETVAKNIDS